MLNRLQGSAHCALHARMRRETYAKLEPKVAAAATTAVAASTAYVGAADELAEVREGCHALAVEGVQYLVRKVLVAEVRPVGQHLCQYDHLQGTITATEATGGGLILGAHFSPPATLLSHFADDHTGGVCCNGHEVSDIVGDPIVVGALGLQEGHRKRREN